MTKKKTPKAGIPIAAGGFGCVFQPALNCSDPKLTKKDGISKLMKSHRADEEMMEIKNIKPIISKISNNKDYFLVSDINSCKPAPLSESDKKGFDTKCINLVPPYSSDNINQNLNKLKIINIPYGGINLTEYFKKFLKNQFTLHKEFYNLNFVKTNTSLIKLLKNAIIPLNKLNYLHLDIKSENILCDSESTLQNPQFSSKVFTRLIDWGLSGSYTPGEIPEIVDNKVIQFNIPFGIVLFTNKLNSNLTLRGETIKNVAKNIYLDFCKGKGHNVYILNILDKFFKTKNSENIIINNITALLQKYTDKNGFFDKTRYFDEVFCKNVDVYGFLTSYLPIVTETMRKTKDYSSHPMSKLIENLLIKYCFSDLYAAKSIPINEIVEELEKLNFIADKKYKISSPKKSLVKSFSLSKGKKRCPKGTKKKSDGKCHQITPKSKTLKKPIMDIKSGNIIIQYSNGKTRRYNLKDEFSWPKGRCPKGTRRNKNGKCEFKK